MTMPEHTQNGLIGFQHRGLQAIPEQGPMLTTSGQDVHGFRTPFGRLDLSIRPTSEPEVFPSGVAQTKPAIPPGIFDAFANTCQRWQLRQSEQIVLLGYKGQEFLGVQLLSGYMPPRTQDVRDRIGYVVAISLGLGALFNEDMQSEREWLHKRHEVLHATPLEFMLRGRMIHLIAVADIVRDERAV